MSSPIVNTCVGQSLSGESAAARPEAELRRLNPSIHVLKGLQRVILDGMELRPPDLSTHDDEPEQSDDEPRGWVAEVLGAAWKSDGDGIYRYVPEPDEPSSTDA